VNRAPPHAPYGSSRPPTAVATDGAARRPDGELTAGLERLGGLIELDGRVSWFPEHLRTQAPVSCYLLSERAEPLLVDSGLVVHRDEVRHGLTAALGPVQRVNVIQTRIVEFDTVGNTAALIACNRVATVYASFPADDWIHFEEAAAGPAAHDASHPRFETMQPGGGVRVGSGTDRERWVSVLAAPLRLLATFWLYDPLTRTLFTSDSFSHVALEHTDGRLVLRSGAPDRTTSEDVRRHLLAKFAWLADADVSPLQAELAGIFEGNAVEHVAPTFGCPISGAGAVARHYGLVQQALSDLGPRSRARRDMADERRHADTPQRAAQADRSPRFPRRLTDRSPRFPRRLTDRVHWLSACLELEEEGETVHAYHSLYVVAGDDASLIVDTGHPKDWAALSAQLDELAEHGIAGVRYVFPTHSEMPHSANLARLLEKYPEAVAVGDVRDYHLSFPGLEDRMCEMRAGDELDLGGTRFVIVEAIIRDLVTSYWGFDTRDRTLFASDGFAYMHHHRAGECGRLADELDELPVAKFTAAFARHALYWTRFTDMRSPVERLRAALEELDVATIAPGHGCPIVNLERTVPEVVRGMLMGAGD